jgi:hypothetical protein
MSAVLDDVELQYAKYIGAKRHLVAHGNMIDTEDTNTVFVDMDDTICDFAGHYKSLHGKYPKECEGNQEFWFHFNKNPVGFFENLEPIPGYLEFLSFVVRHALSYGYNVKFLTALSVHNNRTIEEQLEEKKNWIMKYVIAYGVHITMGWVDCPTNKKMFAAHKEILIDDCKSNIDDWREHKGTGILHTSFTTSMTDLMAAFQVMKELPN